jgi:hypothetical protein
MSTSQNPVIQAPDIAGIIGVEIASEAAALALSGEPSGIEELREQLAKWLSIPPQDEDLIDFCLAVYKSHQIPGDPLRCVSTTLRHMRREFIEFYSLCWAVC